MRKKSKPLSYNMKNVNGMNRKKKTNNQEELWIKRDLWLQNNFTGVIIPYVMKYFMSKCGKIDNTTTNPRSPILDRSPNVGPLISRWELDKFKNCWNISCRTSKILTLLYPQFSNLLISQRDMSSQRLGALSKNRWSGGNSKLSKTSVENFIFSFELRTDLERWLCTKDEKNRRWTTRARRQGY